MSDYVVGRNPVREALKAERGVSRLYVQNGATGGSLGEILALAKAKNIRLEYISSTKLDELAQGARHQGVAAQVAPVAFADLAKVLDKLRREEQVPFLLLLDELQDPQNVGALIRSADAAGVSAVLLPARRSCPLNMTVAKTSAGAIEYVPVVQIGNVSQTLRSLKKQGFWVVGADMAGEISYDEADLTGPLVLIVGAEGKGLGRLVRENCDLVCSIPMTGKVSSLNASVAGAVLMFEAARQRRKR